LKHQLDATPFTKNVPIDETPDTNEAPDTSEAPNETSTANSTPATPNTTTRLKWLLRLLFLLFLLYPNTYSYFYLYFPIHRQYILNSLDVFLAITTLLVAVIAEAVYQLEAGYGECG
jgi:hypothetical protein